MRVQLVSACALWVVCSHAACRCRSRALPATMHTQVTSLHISSFVTVLGGQVWLLVYVHGGHALHLRSCPVRSHSAPGALPLSPTHPSAPLRRRRGYEPCVYVTLSCSPYFLACFSMKSLTWGNALQHGRRGRQDSGMPSDEASSREPCPCMSANRTCLHTVILTCSACQLRYAGRQGCVVPGVHAPPALPSTLSPRRVLT